MYITFDYRIYYWTSFTFHKIFLKNLKFVRVFLQKFLPKKNRNSFPSQKNIRKRKSIKMSAWNLVGNFLMNFKSICNFLQLLELNWLFTYKNGGSTWFINLNLIFVWKTLRMVTKVPKFDEAFNKSFIGCRGQSSSYCLQFQTLIAFH